MENVRVTAPDLERRAALEKTRSRLLVAAAGFMVLFGAVVAKLASATIMFPVMPKLAAEVAVVPDPAAMAAADANPDAPMPGTATALHGPRAMITDRNGEILAISLPTAGLYANPKEMIDPADVAHKLKGVLPRLDEDVVRARLASGKQFVYLARQINPHEQLAINALGHPRRVLPGRRAPPLPAGPGGRAGAGRGGRGRPRHRRGGAVLQRPAAR